MFVLDRPKSESPTFLFLKKKLKDSPVPFKASLEAKILPSHWDKKTRRAQVKGVPKDFVEDNKSLNNLLQDIENFVDAKRRDARYTGKHLTGPQLQQKIDELLGKQLPGTGFYGVCMIIIEDMRTGRLLTPKTGKKYSGGTIKNYTQSLDCIKGHAPGLTFEQVTMDFYRNFSKYCIDKDWSLNYFGQHIKNLKRLMEESRDRGHHANLAYLDKKFITYFEDNDDVALTEDQIGILYDQPCINRSVERDRDWFILDCYTMLRVNDIELLLPRNVNTETIDIVNEKTDTRVSIPIHWMVREILNKWGGLPPATYAVLIGQNIKIVAKEAGLNETVIYSITKGGVRQDFYLPLWQMISPHTARRSGITNLLEAGIPDNQVMQLAGIKKHSTLLRYKKTKPAKNAENLKSHTFFTGK